MNNSITYTAMAVCIVGAMLTNGSIIVSVAYGEGTHTKQHQDICSKEESHNVEKETNTSISTPEALVAAANDNNFQMVKKLINEGIPIDAKNEEGVTALHAACAMRNIEIGRWLIEHKANIDYLAFIYCNRQPASPSRTAAEDELLAAMVVSKLVRQGMNIQLKDAASQKRFVASCKAAIISNLKKNGPWPKDVTAWVLRIVDVEYHKEFGSSFHIVCDVAAWNEYAMLEFVSKTGLLFDTPQRKSGGAFSHVWLQTDNTMSTKFDDKKVFNGNFYITLESTIKPSVKNIKHLRYKDVVNKGLRY